MHSILRSMTISALVFGLAAPALAQEHDHDAHKNHDAKAAKATPKPGQKWSTDAPLRKSMTAIRDVLQANLHKAHEGKLATADYHAIAQKIDAEVAVIFKECKLAPDADAALHEILVPIMDASKAMHAGNDPKAFMKAVTAVNAYGKSFDHKGWKAVAH